MPIRSHRGHRDWGENQGIFRTRSVWEGPACTVRTSWDGPGGEGRGSTCTGRRGPRCIWEQWRNGEGGFFSFYKRKVDYDTDVKPVQTTLFTINKRSVQSLNVNCIATGARRGSTQPPGLPVRPSTVGRWPPRSSHRSVFRAN